MSFRHALWSVTAGKLLSPVGSRPQSVYRPIMIAIMIEGKPSPLKILVVDDDTLNQQMMKVLLEHWGHEVSVAADGLEAVDCVLANQFDLVFMDLQMPRMGGLDASRKIRELEDRRRQTFIVALTASYQPDAGKKMLEVGIDNYIAKPFEVEHVKQLLNYLAVSHRPVESADRAVPAKEITIQSVLDIRRGIERVGSSSDSYWSLLHDFVSELPGRLEVLQRALTSHEFETISIAAHNLKGVSSNLGALQLSEYADRLDRASGAGYTHETAKLVDEVQVAGAALQRVVGLLLSGGRLRTNE